MKKGFSKWSKWTCRDKLNDIEYPGVYVIRKSCKKIAGRKFCWSEEIIYVGETHAQSLKLRLRQFDNTINGKNEHGGAQRVKHNYESYEKLVPELYVSIRPYKCNYKGYIGSKEAKDLRVIGTILKLEYECFAAFKEEFKELPKFNDPKRSSKR